MLRADVATRGSQQEIDSCNGKKDIWNLPNPWSRTCSMT